VSDRRAPSYPRARRSQSQAAGDLYLLFFIHVGTRRVVAPGVAANPDAEWVAQQARNVPIEMAELGLPARYLLLDYDTKFTKDFEAVFEADGTEVKRVGPVSPNLNAHAERWALSLRTECLDHFVVRGSPGLSPDQSTSSRTGQLHRKAKARAERWLPGRPRRPAAAAPRPARCRRHPPGRGPARPVRAAGEEAAAESLRLANPTAGRE
jgi:hypothetical protein